MDDTVRRLIERLTTELSSWLEQPSEASKELAAIRSRIDGLKGQLGGPGLNEMIMGLTDAERAAERQRQHEAAIAIAEPCRPLAWCWSPKSHRSASPGRGARTRPRHSPRASDGGPQARGGSYWRVTFGSLNRPRATRKRIHLHARPSRT